MPQILINREPLRNLNFDVELLGDCDGIVSELCHRLEGDFVRLAMPSGRLLQIRRDELETPQMSPAHEGKTGKVSQDSDPGYSTVGHDASGYKVNEEVVAGSCAVGLDTDEAEEGKNAASISRDSKDAASTSLEASKAESDSCKASSETKEGGQDMNESSTEEGSKQGQNQVGGQEGQETECPEVEDVRTLWKPRCINLGSRVKGECRC